MRDIRDKMQQYVGEYRKYQNYLDRVVNETGEFQSINEIFNRYETLIEARQALSDHQDRNLQMLEDKGTEIVLFELSSILCISNMIVIFYKFALSSLNYLI